jgi:hypothetical protein
MWPRFVRDNSLSIVFGLLFLAALVGQSIAGYHEENEVLAAHDEATMSYGRYLVSSSFGAEMLENWQSEYLQFTLFILATVWLFQRGSSRSGRRSSASRPTSSSGSGLTPALAHRAGRAARTGASVSTPTPSSS